jgi:hypothetical protein
MQTINQHEARSTGPRAEMLELGLPHTRRFYGPAALLTLGLLDVAVAILSLATI